MNEFTRPPHIAVDWRAVPSAAECGGCAGGGFAIDLPAPGCDRVIKNLQAWQARYDIKVDAFIAGPFSNASVDAQLDRWS